MQVEVVRLFGGFGLSGHLAGVTNLKDPHGLPRKRPPPPTAGRLHGSISRCAKVKCSRGVRCPIKY